MSRRRQKISLKSKLENDLKQFIGRPNSPLLRAEVIKVIAKSIGIEVLVASNPIPAVEHITIDIER